MLLLKAGGEEIFLDFVKKYRSPELLSDLDSFGFRYGGDVVVVNLKIGYVENLDVLLLCKLQPWLFAIPGLYTPNLLRNQVGLIKFDPSIRGKAHFVVLIILASLGSSVGFLYGMTHHLRLTKERKCRKNSIEY